MVAAKATQRPPAAREPTPERPTAKAFLERLKAHATEKERQQYDRYFPPEDRRLGDKDRFIGVRMGTVFELAKAFIDMEPSEIETLLESDIHEARAGAVSTMSKQYQRRKTPEARRQELYELYLRRHDRINNWDLVDLGAWYVVGSHLVGKLHDVLFKLAKSKNAWERRTAILATFAFIREGDYDDTYAIAELLLKEKEDLVQKAVGWMLRSAGNDRKRLTAFLDEHAAAMPRTMLRNAIEKFEPAQRQHYLSLKQES